MYLKVAQFKRALNLTGFKSRCRPACLIQPDIVESHARTFIPGLSNRTAAVPAQFFFRVVVFAQGQVGADIRICSYSPDGKLFP